MKDIALIELKDELKHSQRRIDYHNTEIEKHILSLVKYINRQEEIKIEIETEMDRKGGNKMKQIIRIWNDEHDFRIGHDEVTNIAVYDVGKDGTITYRVIQGGQVHYPKSKDWKETSQIGFF